MPRFFNSWELSLFVVSFFHLLLGQCRLGRVAEQLGYGGLDGFSGRAGGLPCGAAGGGPKCTVLRTFRWEVSL